MNLIAEDRPWPKVEGVKIPLAEVVQFGISRWNRRTGGFPTDILLDDVAMVELMAARQAEDAARWFGPPDAPMTFCGLLVHVNGTSGIRLVKGLVDEPPERVRVGRFSVPTDLVANIPMMEAVMKKVKQLGGRQLADGSGFEFMAECEEFEEIIWGGDMFAPEVPVYAPVIGGSRFNIHGVDVTWQRKVNGERIES